MTGFYEGRFQKIRFFLQDCFWNMFLNKKNFNNFVISKNGCIFVRYEKFFVPLVKPEKSGFPILKLEYFNMACKRQFLKKQEKNLIIL